MTTSIKQRQNIHRQLKANQEKLDALEEQIMATQKLAVMGTMSCLVAHEFNNLLVPIINYSELALKHPDDTALIQKSLEKIIKHGNQASQIIHNMLGLARDNSQERETVKIIDLAQAAMHCLARDLSKDKITVSFDIPDDLSVTVVRGQLQQVMLNMIINARQAMLDRPGTLAIKAHQKDNNTVEINVSDTGCGIPAENIEKIFDPFFSTRTRATPPDRQGSGLGLLVCRNIIESHLGTINVTSELDKGTTFTITLPVQQHK